MKVALAVPRLTPEIYENLKEIERNAAEAARFGAQLVLFPEMSLTGFAHTGEPDHDRRLAVQIPGPETEYIADLAHRCSLYLAIGLLESDGGAIFDTALLFGPDGRILLKYRRVSPTWHYQSADPAVYREGSTIPICDTPIGKFAFLICGDIMFDDIAERVRVLKPDWLLFPLARGFDADVHSDQEWEGSEIRQYGERVARIGACTLLANYVAEMDGYFGGAVAFSADGSVIASRALHEPGLLLVDLLDRLPRPNAIDMQV